MLQQCWFGLLKEKFSFDVLSNRCFVKGTADLSQIVPLALEVISETVQVAEITRIDE